MARDNYTICFRLLLIAAADQRICTLMGDCDHHHPTEVPTRKWQYYFRGSRAKLTEGDISQLLYELEEISIFLHVTWSPKLLKSVGGEQSLRPRLLKPVLSTPNHSPQHHRGSQVVCAINHVHPGSASVRWLSGSPPSLGLSAVSRFLCRER